MEYRYLGRTGLKVSTLALGTMTFGGKGIFAKVGSAQVAEAQAQVDVCLDSGVNLVDTADSYSNGKSEEILGEVLKGRRAEVVLATKVRFRTGDGPNDEGLTRRHIIQACEDSLRRLGTDYIDLYQVHSWDGATALEETVGALASLVEAGKVRYLGVSNYSAWQFMKTLSVIDRQSALWLASHQIHYSLEAREAEYELIPAAIDQSVGVLVWSPLAGGLLSGKYQRNQPPPPDSRLATDWGEPPIRDDEHLFRIIDVLMSVAESSGASPAQVALAYLLRKPAITSLIIGARTCEQLKRNLAAAELRLEQRAFEDLDAVSRPPLVYPYWHQARWGASRLSEADLALIQPHLAQ